MMRAAGLAALLAFAGMLLLCHASRGIPASQTPLQEAAFKLAALHADSGTNIQSLHLPTQPVDAAVFDIHWPSLRPYSQAQLSSINQHEQSLDYPEVIYDNSDAAYNHGHAEEEMPPAQESCLWANTLTFRVPRHGGDSQSTVSQDFHSCCPKDNTFGPEGPFAPKAAREAGHIQYSHDRQARPGTAVPWPSAAQPVQRPLLSYCNWTEPYVDDTFMPTPDLTTGVVPVGYIDGTCYLSRAVDRCGLDIPIAPSFDLGSSAAWTMTVQKAVVYAAFSKAYTPPIPGLSNGTAVGFGAYGSESRPTCGISLAIVAKGSLQDQQQREAGIAYITDELLWCVLNGSDVGIGVNDAESADGSGKAVPEAVPNCLPYSNIYVQPNHKPQPPVNVQPGPWEDTPVPAPVPVSGAGPAAPAPALAPAAPAPTRAPVPAPVPVPVPVPMPMPVPVPVPVPVPAPAPAPAPAGAGPYAWQAKLAAVAIQELGKHTRRAAHMPGIFTSDFMGMDGICSNPIVGFANPGSLKVTVELNPHRQ